MAGLRIKGADGELDAIASLVELAGERGDLDVLRRLAAAGSPDAADELRRLAGAGSHGAEEGLTGEA
ncbi:hypothetical protein [Winogradskya humida]|uniref:hypothetical protein n=1 Tax=Winogradskya humida TaxID=113566 RepID=UPI001942A0EB|nr:hypothetical protein [Actinoplanes humidus]